MVAKHLLFRFMNNDTRGYIPTRELLERIQGAGLPIKSERAFRQEIIGKLRDPYWGMSLFACCLLFVLSGSEMAAFLVKVPL